MRKAVYTLREAAAILGVSQRWFRYRVSSGWIKVVRSAADAKASGVERAELVRLCMRAGMSPADMRLRLNDGPGVVCCAYRPLGVSVAGSQVVYTPTLFGLGRLIDSDDIWLAVVNAAAVGPDRCVEELAEFAAQADRPTMVAMTDGREPSGGRLADLFDFVFPVDTPPETVGAAIGRIRRSEL